MMAEVSVARLGGSVLSTAMVDRAGLHGWDLMSLPPPSIKTARSWVLRLSLLVVVSLAAARVAEKVSESSMQLSCQLPLLELEVDLIGLV
jgi:hypothetical protein